MEQMIQKIKEVWNLGGQLVAIIVLAFIGWQFWQVIYKIAFNDLAHIQASTEQLLKNSEKQIEILNEIKNKL